jgi:hypothetical protein
MGKPLKRVKLKGEELENMRTLSVTARQHLLVTGQRTLKLLGVRRRTVRAVIFFFNDTKKRGGGRHHSLEVGPVMDGKQLVWDGDSIVGVYEDPPGVCREPTEDEKADEL